MAPFNDLRRSYVQRWKGDRLKITPRDSISPRQDGGDNKDGGGFGGFGRGNGRGRFGNKDGDDSGGRDGNGNGNGRGRFGFGGNRDNSGDNNGRGGGRFGGGNDNNDFDNNRSRFGNNRGGGRGNGNGNGGNNGNDNNNNGGNGNNRNGGNGNGNGNGFGNGNDGLDPTVERILISVGSIGAFILISFVCYLVWRALRKAKREKGSSKPDRSEGGFLGRFTSRSATRNRRAWESLDDSVPAPVPAPAPAKGSPPSYREKASTVGVPQGFYAPEKTQPAMPPQPQPQPRAPTPKSVDLFAAVQRPTGPPPMPEELVPRVPRVPSLNGVSAVSTLVNSHQAQDSFSSTAPMQFDTTTTEPDGSDTARSRMGPGVFFNQSEMARQPSTAYDPARRQVNRTSVLSSLSSGFGDGDIVVPAQTVTPPPQAALATSGGEPPNYSRRFSWSSRGTSHLGSRRDTIFTQSSEDMPPRFRSLTSWIDQQTGRIKRAQQREAEQGTQPMVTGALGQAGIPGIHNPPREPSFGMMMDDEQPRRVEYPIPASQ
ncbi:hypothetical protein V8F20_007718 [Naviculisporaceae sp. PSN 640]